MGAQVIKEVNSFDMLELPRRLWHSCIGIVIVTLYYLNVSTFHVFLALLPPLLIYGLLDWYRLRDDQRNARFCATFPHPIILRPGERSRMTSSTFYLMGVETVLVGFSRPVAVLALLYLAWCDPVAGIIGRWWKQQRKLSFPLPNKGGSNSRKNVDGPWIRIPSSGSWLDIVLWNGKTLAGSLSAALMGFLITIVFLSLTISWEAQSTSATILGLKLIGTSILGGIIAAISEFVTISDWDDNLTMPIMAAFMLTLLTPLHAFYPEVVV